MRISFSILLMAFAVMACKTQTATAPVTSESAGPMEATVITQKTYDLVLRSYASEEIAEVYTNDDLLLQVDLNNRAFTGKTGCNSFNGKAILETEDQVAFKKIAVTERMCDKATMEVEARYLNALSNESFNILAAEEKIIFTSINGKIKLIFEEKSTSKEN